MVIHSIILPCHLLFNKWLKNRFRNFPKVLVNRWLLFAASKMLFWSDHSIKIFHDLGWCYVRPILLQIILLSVFSKVLDIMLRFRFFVPLLNSLSDFFFPCDFGQFFYFNQMMLRSIINSILLQNLLSWNYIQVIKGYYSQAHVPWLNHITLELSQRIIWSHVATPILLWAYLSRRLYSRFVPHS